MMDGDRIKWAYLQQEYGRICRHDRDGILTVTLDDDKHAISKEWNLAYKHAH
jgi:hypothetical protein